MTSVVRDGQRLMKEPSFGDSRMISLRISKGVGLGKPLEE